jgi:hypothetical protein
MIQGYVTVGVMAKRWDLSERQVQKLCREGRIPEAVQFGRSWAIPQDTAKPTRTAKSKPGPRPKGEPKQQMEE